jgi:hypothetical protein
MKSSSNSANSAAHLAILSIALGLWNTALNGYEVTTEILVSLKVMAQLPGCNEDCIKQLIHFQVPCLDVMEDLTDVVHQALDGTDPPWGFGSSTSMGSGPEGPWLLGPENALGAECRSGFTILSPAPLLEQSVMVRLLERA